MDDIDAAAGLLDVALPHLSAGTRLTHRQYAAIDSAALGVMDQIAPESLTAPSLALTRQPVRGDNPRTLRYAGTVFGEYQQTDVEVSVLADAEGPPVVAVRSKPLPEPPFWDEVGEVVVRSLGEDRLARIRLLLQVSGHAARAALWQQHGVVEPGKFAHAFESEATHLGRAASALQRRGGPFGSEPPD